MRYKPEQRDVICVIPHGSHLYGTQGPESDYDFKAVYLPVKSDLLMGRGLKVHKFKFDAAGNKISDKMPMPPGGYEAEHFAVQQVVNDYVDGQAYAVELVFAVVNGFHWDWLDSGGHNPGVLIMGNEFTKLCHVLTTRFVHANVAGMTGFALKQTLDYVRRGERLNAAAAVFNALVEAIDLVVAELKGNKMTAVPRMDTPLGEHGTVLDYIVQKTGTPIGEVMAHDKPVRTLYLNGRHYTETTPLTDLHRSIDTLILEYGERAEKASKKGVDWKSLSHAVRVFQQVIELLQTGKLVFPRPNSGQLRPIKLGQVPMEDVKQLLRGLDDQVNTVIETSTLPKVDEAFRKEVDTYMAQWLLDIYQ